MKITTFLVTGLGILSLAGAANAATVKYKATLNGTRAGTTSTATAVANFDYDDVAKTLSGDIAYENLTTAGTSAHLHVGACGDKGTSFKAITPDDGATAATGGFTLTALTLDEDQIAALEGGETFLSISDTTNEFPAYEIRGQILKLDVADTCMVGPSADAGTDTDSGASTGSGSSTTDAGSTTTAETPSTTTTDDGGCNASGSSTGSSGLVALGLGLALYGLTKKKKKKQA